MAQSKRRSRTPVHERKHHWLMSAKVMFMLGDSEEVSHFEHNITLTNKREFVSATMIGQAQQAVQLALFEQARDPKIRMLNVHIQNISYLGHMSSDEFLPKEGLNDETGDAAEATEVTSGPVGMPSLVTDADNSNDVFADTHPVLPN